MPLWDATFEIGIRAIEEPDNSLAGIIRVTATSRGRKVVGVSEVFCADPTRSTVQVADNLDDLFLYGSSIPLSQNFNRGDTFYQIEGLKGYIDKDLGGVGQYYLIPVLASGFMRTSTVREGILEGLLKFTKKRLSVWIALLQSVGYEAKEFGDYTIDKRLMNYPHALNEKARQKAMFALLDKDERFEVNPVEDTNVRIISTRLGDMPHVAQVISRPSYFSKTY